MQFRRAIKAQSALLTLAQFIILLSFVNSVFADNDNETTRGSCNEMAKADQNVTGNMSNFGMTRWLNRGTCIRTYYDKPCYTTLLDVLTHLNELRRAEYAGAAGVLAILPTIGALLGAPSNEVWTFLTILPFGGALAMALSFGGAIMPVNVEDYEHAMKKRNIAIGSIVTFRTKSYKNDQKPLFKKLEELEEKVGQRISHEKRLRPDRRPLFAALFCMVLLFGASQTAMTVLEQGAVIPHWCTSRWWLHLWYIMATLAAIAENWVQLPFKESHRLYVSRVPYEITLSKGVSILPGGASNNRDDSDTVSEDGISDAESQCIGRALNQLSTIPAAKVHFRGSTQPTETRNAVLVMISVVGSRPSASVWRLMSKTFSIGVFITGTALFASSTLVAMPMAVMALTLVLSAGVFGRAIAGWMVRRVADEEPMIHVIVNSEDEANKAICCILKLSSADGAHVQVEIRGHVLVNGRRVASRRRWNVSTLGVLASPYNLLGARDHHDLKTSEGHSTGLLSGDQTVEPPGSPARNETV